MFLKKDGFDILHFEDIPWTHRVRFDGMKSRARIYTDGLDYGLRMTLVDFPYGSTEPRHVHPGTHVTTVMKNRALVDGLTLKPLDVLRLPPGAQHGIARFPQDATLLAATMR